MPKPLSCLVISDGRRGIENQALGLAEAISRIRPLEIIKKRTNNSFLFNSLPPYIQLTLARKPVIAKPVNIAIGCGRQAIAVLLGLKKKYGKRIFTIYVQDPRISLSGFDLVIAPKHDELKADNIISIIGSPNRITNELLQKEKQKFAEKISGYPAPYVCVLIGGKSKTHNLSDDIHQKHLRLICSLADKNYSIFLSTSRRTPEHINNEYKAMSKDRSNVWFYDGHNPDSENPYFAFLASADHILVTEDSTNMLTEACATGKPVYRLEMAGNAGKFAKLYQDLQKKCNVTRFEGELKNHTYIPLAETQIAAEIIDKKLAHNKTVTE